MLSVSLITKLTLMGVLNFTACILHEKDLNGLDSPSAYLKSAVLTGLNIGNMFLFKGIFNTAPTILTYVLSTVFGVSIAGSVMIKQDTFKDQLYVNIKKFTVSSFSMAFFIKLLKDGLENNPVTSNTAKSVVNVIRETVGRSNPQNIDLFNNAAVSLTNFLIFYYFIYFAIFTIRFGLLTTNFAHYGNIDAKKLIKDLVNPRKL